MSKNGTIDKDHYNTSFREAMKKSMELPAGEWKPLNRRGLNTLDKVLLAILLGLSIFSIVCTATYLVMELALRLGR